MQDIYAFAEDAVGFLKEIITSQSIAHDSPLKQRAMHLIDNYKTIGINEGD